MGLLRTLFWFGLFLVSTFAFTVLFEHGVSDFGTSSQKEWDSLVQYYNAKVNGPAKADPKTR